MTGDGRLGTSSLKIGNYRTLIVLTCAQCFGQTAAPILVLLGGIVGAQIAPSVDWATLPIAIQIAGIASATIPASYLMSKVGRKLGFLAGTALAICAALFAAWGIYQQSFTLFCIASFFIGNYIVGSFLGMAVMLSVSFLILLVFYRDSTFDKQETETAVRPLGQIFRQPKVILAIVSAAVGYSIMSLIMTATPLSMHEMDHHSLEDTTRVIQSHILAMYIPSFFSGFLISWLGVKRIIQAGFVLMITCIVVGWGQPGLIDYWGTLVLLGIGWNFLFLGGTTLLTQSYRSSERFKVQAINDFLVFGLQALGSLSAGVLLANIGWSGVMVFALPLLLLIVPVTFYARKSLA